MEKVFAIYSRKSRFTGKGESVENQIEMCREYLRIHFGEDEAKKAVIYEDEGFSGKNLDRPQFKAMFEDIKNGKISAVLCYRLDRISRNIGDFANLITELTSMGVTFISMAKQSGNIFKEQKSGSFNGSNSCNFKEQCSSCIVKSVSAPCD